MRFIPESVNNLPYKPPGSYSSISTMLPLRKSSNDMKHNILHQSMLNRVIHSRRLRENGFYKARRNEVGGCGKLVISSDTSVSSKNAPSSVMNPKKGEENTGKGIFLTNMGKIIRSEGDPVDSLCRIPGG